MEDNAGLSHRESEGLFEQLTEGKDRSLNDGKLIKVLEENGISRNDPRVKEMLGDNSKGPKGKDLDKAEFIELLQKPAGDLLVRTLRKKLVIPDFKDFSKDVKEIFKQTKGNTAGEMDETLPHPAKDRQPAYAVSICTVDGQLLQLGDHDLGFLLQSICKPINYAIVHEEVGKEKVHQHVGVEPGNESFDSGMILNEKDLPHNPLITSGAIMTSTFIKQGQGVEERLKHVMQVWEKMTGDKKVGYNPDSFEAERKEADKQLALAHIMKARGAFPEGIDLKTELEFYLKCCAIEVNIDDLAHAAATLANYGQCPTTGEKVFSHDAVRDTLSLMLTSGTYGHSGEFAFRVGLPAKSGIAGGIMVVVPQLMGIAIYSPPLDEHGNSVRGIDFCEKMVDKFNIHLYDAPGIDIHGKKDPRK